MYKERLIELRENNNIKQYSLAEKLKIYKGTFNQYETEYQIIPIKHLNSLCVFFNVSLDYIFDFTNELNYDNSLNDINKSVSGFRLKELRKENMLTQEKFAKILNVGKTTITEYERGTNVIATPFLYTICSKYKISADYLLGKVDKPKYLK
ncbi:MAG: helix-turn-helix domain-containing protein [Ruminococcus sp.]|nr:helix-turn-helix domain-containing protein [Ruminococcus sp.]